MRLIVMIALCIVIALFTAPFGVVGFMVGMLMAMVVGFTIDPLCDMLNIPE